MKKYSIWGREHGANHDTVLAEVDRNPEAMKAALHGKTLSVSSSIFPGGRKVKVKRYLYLRIVENKP